MRTIGIIAVTLVVSVPTHLLTTGSKPRNAEPAPGAAPPEVRSPEDPGRTTELERLELELAQLQATVNELSARLGDRLEPSRRAAFAGVSSETIEALARRWLDANAPPSEDDRPSGSLATLPVAGIQDWLAERRPFDPEAQLLYEELRASGRIDELVEASQQVALERPNDPDAQLALGMASIQALFGLGASPEAGMLAMQADTAFDRALDLDPQHIDARVAKAISLANWPTFMGKTPEAIEHFEILIDQTSSPNDPRAFPDAHAYLGNLYERIGESDKALATWRAGLERWPDHEDLRRSVELAGGTGEEGAGEER